LRKNAALQHVINFIMRNKDCIVKPPIASHRYFAGVGAFALCADVSPSNRKREQRAPFELSTTIFIAACAIFYWASSVFNLEI
jgi:hypothetical protein